MTTTAPVDPHAVMRNPRRAAIGAFLVAAYLLLNFVVSIPRYAPSNYTPPFWLQLAGVASFLAIAAAIFIASILLATGAAAPSPPRRVPRFIFWIILTLYSAPLPTLAALDPMSTWHTFDDLLGITWGVSYAALVLAAWRFMSGVATRLQRPWFAAFTGLIFLANFVSTIVILAMLATSLQSLPPGQLPLISSEWHEALGNVLESIAPFPLLISLVGSFIYWLYFAGLCRRRPKASLQSAPPS